MTKETKDLGAAPPRSGDDTACVSTDRELYRGPPGDYYADSLHVTASGGIGINVGGFVVVKSLRQWHRLAWTDPDQRPARGPYPLVGPGNAPQAPPDSSAALLEARRLLGLTQDVIRQAQVEGEDHGDRCRGLATLAVDAGKMLATVRAFLRSDSERSEHGKG